MSTFSASSLFAGINAGVTNSYAILSNMYSGGLTQKNLSQNFGTLDKNNDGTLSTNEVQKLMTQMSTRGLTRDQVTSLGGMSGISADTQATIIDHFNDIDSNHDGYVSSAEVQGYILQSKLKNQKVKDQQKMINRTSLFYGDDNASDSASSLLSYKWIQDDTNSRSS